MANTTVVRMSNTTVARQGEKKDETRGLYRGTSLIRNSPPP